MRLQRIGIGVVLLLLVLCTKTNVTYAAEQEEFDFNLVTEERPYDRPEGGFQHPLIIQGNDVDASYTTSLDGYVAIHHAVEGEIQINPQAVEMLGWVTITGTSSNGSVVTKRYHITGTYLTGFYIELAQDKEMEFNTLPQGYEHEHYYVPTEVTRPTKWSDGVNAKACIQCGDITEPTVVSSAHVFLQETYNQIKAAGAGETIRLEFGTYNSLPPELIEKIAEKNDVTYQIHFIYENENYDFAIERGAQLEIGADWYGPEMLIKTFHHYIA